MTGTLIIRPITELDLDGIVRLDEKLSGEYRPDRWESRLMFSMRRDPFGSFVALEDGSVVGFIFGDVRGEDFGFPTPTGWVEVLAVDPQHRKKKVGSQLTDRLLKHFQERGVRDIRTMVRPDQPHMAEFFERVGFVQEPVVVYRFSEGVKNNGG